MQSILKLKCKKSPGNDGITNEFLINLPETALSTLQKVFTEILTSHSWPEGWNNADIKMIFKKGEKSNPTNYRPIALENSTFKLFTNILNNRLTKWTDENNIIPEFQNGFRAKRGCTDNIFIMKCLIDLPTSDNNALFAVFIDFKGAFDNVNHQELWEHLIDNKISSQFLNLFKKLYETSMVRICTSQGNTEFVKFVKGLFQGDPPSSTIFNTFTNDIELHFKRKGFRGIKVSENSEILMLAYADDIVIFSKTPIDLKDKLLALEDYCSKKKLSINTEKTKIVIFKKRIDKKLHKQFELCGKPLEIVDKMNYLGFTFYRTGNMDQ
jgi:hypothetical protein